MDEHDANQKYLRPRIAREMDSEFVVCDLDTFRRSYLPFNPSEEDIQTGLKALRDRGQVGSDARNNPQWKGLTQPSRCDGTEAKVLNSLRDIFDTLSECRLSETNASRSCNFLFRNHPDTPLSADIPEYKHRIDGSFIKSSQTGPEDWKAPREISSADVGVSVEFKTNKSDEDIHDNRMKILSAANHIINDDARRMFTFGMTIEGDEMTLWCFSRSHSVKSAPFNFIQNLGDFTAVSLSLMFSSDEEVGYDPCVTRSKDGSGYIYRFEGQSAEERYFQTRRLIVEYRSLCITERMTRIWEAIEVDKAQTSEIGGPVVLKDVWLDEAARTEKQIQDELFHDILSGPPLDSREELSDEIRTHLKQVLTNDKYKEYFLDIVCDYRGETTKSLAPSTSPERGLFDPPPSTPPPSPPITQYPFSPIRAPPPAYHTPWKCVPKRQYRLVYNEVCEALHDLDSLQVITGVVADCLTALQLLYCAGWVHRDVSSGNILAYKVEGTMRGKLADLEYAKKFALTPGSPDPRIGTPFFMPFEIQSEQYLSQPIQRGVRKATFSVEPMPTPRTPTRPPLRFNFQHDLESLWWVLLWVITQGPSHGPSRGFAANIFQNRFDTRLERQSVVMNPGCLPQKARFHPSVQEYGNSLCQCMVNLEYFYVVREQRNELDNSASYAGIHNTMYEHLQLWTAALDKNGDVAIELRSKRGPDAKKSSNSQQTKRGPPEDDSEPSQGNWHPKRSRQSSGPSKDDTDHQPQEGSGSEPSRESQFPKRPRLSSSS